MYGQARSQISSAKSAVFAARQYVARTPSSVIYNTIIPVHLASATSASKLNLARQLISEISEAIRRTNPQQTSLVIRLMKNIDISTLTPA
jgi:hypothetical protein